MKSQANRPTTLAAITDAEAARFLHRAKFGATEADIAAVKAQGYSAWLDAQFKSPRGMSGAAWLDSQGHNAVTKEAEYFNPTAGDFMIWNQLLAQPDEMRQRCAFSLSQYFVVSLNPIDGFWPPYIMAAWWNVLLDGAFGNFRELLERVTLNAGMGMYLNTKGNLKEDAKTGREPDENYAREIMQLFTIGLYELNPDGTNRLGANGKPIETYVQADVTSLAHVFTGYDHDMSRVKFLKVAWQNYPVLTTEFTSDPMRFEPKNHSNRAVTFLGTTIPQGTPGPDALKIALDKLFAHPNVGPFFCRQMIQRLVTSNPSPAYVKRAADAFADNGAGVRGDMKAVWKAVLLDPEALAPADPKDAMAGKLREPVQRVLSWARTVGMNPGDGKYKIYNLSREDQGIGQSPLRSSSVFNFFRPGYVPPHTAIAKAGRQAPEFQITNETSVAGYINYLQSAVRASSWPFFPEYQALKPIGHDAAAVVNWFNLHLAANQLSPATVTLITTALASKNITQGSPDNDKLEMIAAACLLVMSAPEYLVQK